MCLKCVWSQPIAVWWTTCVLVGTTLPALGHAEHLEDPMKTGDGVAGVSQNQLRETEVPVRVLLTA